MNNDKSAVANFQFTLLDALQVNYQIKRAPQKFDINLYTQIVNIKNWQLFWALACTCTHSYTYLPCI